MKIQYRPRAVDGAFAHDAKHMRRLLAADKARRSVKRERKVSRGQTLIIFALTFTILIGFLGLAIDTIRLYDVYARMQRAAEAGALAGVIYMPNNYTTNLTSAPGDNAVCRALQEAFKNSFGPNCTTPSQTPATPCPSSVSSVEIAVCKVYDNTNALKPYDLQVTISENVSVLFISALNVGPLRISASATAEFIPPVQIASDPGTAGGTGSWGTFGECGNSGSGASAACTGTGVRNFAGNVNGPGELKEQGDPLVSCEEGPTNVSADTTANVSPEPYTTYTGLPTNHQQYTQYANPGAQPVGCTNPDTNNVFTGVAYIASDGTEPVRPGYAFYVNMENAAADTNLWIWNLPFDPAKPPSCNGRQSTGQTSYDIFYEYNCKGANGSPYPYYPATNSVGPASPQVCNGQDPYTCTDPNLLFSVTYSVYDISLANPTAGTLVGVMQAFPLITNSQCASGQYLQEGSTGLGVAQTCVSPLCVAQWCPMATNTQRGSDNNTNPWTNLDLKAGHDYRVMVVTSDYGTPTDTHMGWGGHSFSLKLCPASSVSQSNVQTCTTPTGASVSGWNMSDVLFTFPGNGTSTTQTTEYPLGVVQANYSGRTIDVSLFDPGDLIGSSKGVSIYGAVPNLNLPGTPDPCAETAAQLQAAGYDPTINGKNFQFPSGERTTLFNGNIPALEPTMNDDLIYNGLWKDEQITMPASYTTTAWTLCAQAPLLNDSDVLAIKVLALGQSPVHLVQ